MKMNFSRKGEESSSNDRPKTATTCRNISRLTGSLKHYDTFHLQQQSQFPPQDITSLLNILLLVAKIKRKGQNWISSEVSVRVERFC